MTSEPSPNERTRARHEAATEINGLKAVVVTKQIQRFGITSNLASVAFRTSPNEVYGFTFATTEPITQSRVADFRAIAEGFVLLSAEERAQIKPYRVQIITAGSGDTVATLAESSVYADFPVDRFRALNGLSGGIEAGDRLKLIVER